jgi:ATP/ADP translocase
VHRSVWEQAFIEVDSAQRSAVKIAVDGVAARIAEALGAFTIFLWLKKMAPDGVLSMPLDTNWIAWGTLITVAAWLLITQNLRVQIKKDGRETMPAPTGDRDIEPERFPDQCPCTTELGKRIA